MIKKGFLIISQKNTCVGVSFLIKLQTKDLKFYYKETSAQAFSCIYFETPSKVNCLIFCCCLNDILLMLLSLLVLPDWVDEKLFSRCQLPFFRIFPYVLLKFDWLMIFFLKNPTRKLKILNLFFSHLFQCGFSNTIIHAQF